MLGRVGDHLPRSTSSAGWTIGTLAARGCTRCPRVPSGCKPSSPMATPRGCRRSHVGVGVATENADRLEAADDEAGERARERHAARQREPAAMPIMLDSAIPRVEGGARGILGEAAVMVDFDRSASRVTMRSLRAQLDERLSERDAAGLGRHRSPLTPCRGYFLVECAQLADDGRGRLVGREIAVPGASVTPRISRMAATASAGFGACVPLRVVLHERHALALTV